MNSKPFYALVALSLTFMACMRPAETEEIVEEQINPCVQNPASCQPGNLSDDSYNLAEYAIVSANGALNEKFLAQQVRDGIARVGSNGSTEALYTSWLPKANTVNDAWVRFEWSTPVEIDGVRLYDHGSPNSLVTRGEVRFESTDDSEYLAAETFELGEDQTRGLFESSDGKPDMGELVTGPGSGKKVKAMEVRILSHASTESISGAQVAGFNEIYVIGRRIKETSQDVENTTNLLPFARVVDASSVKDVQSHLAGPYSARKVNDGATATEWVSAAGGSNSSISLEFDLPYCIRRLVLKDRSDSNHRFEHAKIIVNDSHIITDAMTGSKAASASSLEVIVPVDFRKDIEKITIQLDDVTGADSGLSEIEAYACDPS